MTIRSWDKFFHKFYIYNVNSASLKLSGRRSDWVGLAGIRSSLVLSPMLGVANGRVPPSFSIEIIQVLHASSDVTHNKATHGKHRQTDASLPKIKSNVRNKNIQHNNNSNVKHSLRLLAFMHSYCDGILQAYIRIFLQVQVSWYFQNLVKTVFKKYKLKHHSSHVRIDCIFRCLDEQSE